MARIKVDPFDFLEETNKLMRGNGLLLVSAGKGNKPNAMTIGWGLVGTMWRQPSFAIAVRPSRYTYRLLEESGEFTVCLPAKGMDNVLEFCGARSGRDVDKFKELKLTASKGNDVSVPHIAECPVHYECKTAFRTELKPGQLIKALEDDVYASGDYHVIYFGLIKGVYAEKGAAKMLPE